MHLNFLGDSTVSPHTNHHLITWRPTVRIPTFGIPRFVRANGKVTAVIQARLRVNGAGALQLVGDSARWEVALQRSPAAPRALGAAASCSPSFQTVQTAQTDAGCEQGLARWERPDSPGPPAVSVCLSTRSICDVNHPAVRQGAWRGGQEMVIWLGSTLHAVLGGRTMQGTS